MSWLYHRLQQATDRVNQWPTYMKELVEIMSEPKMNPWVPTTNLMELRRLGKLAEELGELQAVVGRYIIQRLDGVDPVSGKTSIDEKLSAGIRSLERIFETE